MLSNTGGFTSRGTKSALTLILYPRLSPCTYSWEENAFRWQTNRLEVLKKGTRRRYRDLSEMTSLLHDNTLKCCLLSSFPHCSGEHLCRAQHRWAHLPSPLERSSFKARVMPRTITGPPKPQTLPIPAVYQLNNAHPLHGPI